MTKTYLAIDIGASSGRHILGWEENGAVKTVEVHRFPNGPKRSGGHLVWDLPALVSEVRRGIDKTIAAYGAPRSLSIDTWGVDYVLLDGEREIEPCYAYRDERTTQAIERVHALMPFSELYRRTGIQFQLFNTIYQLYADKLAGRLERATDYLMLPEYLLWKLCGVKAHEYTNATTGGMVSAETGAFDPVILETLGFPNRLFGSLWKPGTVLGQYRGIDCVLCATHDTASAVEGIPMQSNQPYISSGTWSLLGVKTEKAITTPESERANWSNEGGVGYNRYQKNIMGMWLVNRLREELCPDAPFEQLVRGAQESDFDALVDANDARFLAPESMKAAFNAALTEKPAGAADYFRCAWRSLAASYQTASAELEANTGRTYDTLYIVGGGAKNDFLNRLTEKATGKRVVALPIEATALGNLKIQREADK